MAAKARRRSESPRSSTSGAILCFLLVSASVSSLRAQERPALREELERIFGKDKAYEPETFGPARWIEGGDAYTTLEPSASATSDGAKDVVRYQTGSGERDILISASKLVPEGATSPLTIDDYSWSDDRARVLIYTNAKRVWRQNTRGDYWVLEIASGALRKLGGIAPPSSLMFAKFAPDGKRVAYVHSNDIYIEDLRTGAVTPLTSGGSATAIHGTSDWVYEEELGLRDAFRFSPDGKRIAYWIFDSSGVGEFKLIDDTDTLYPQLTRIPYPKSGTTNSAVSIGVVSSTGGETVSMRVPGDPRQSYLARVEWAPDNEHLAIEHLNRLQNENEVLLGQATSGEVGEAYRDRSDAWVEIVDRIEWIDGGKAFVWLSEKDGWRHAYRVASDGAGEHLVTRFDGDVIQSLGLDSNGTWLYFLASPANATQQYLYRSKVTGNDPPQRLTPANEPGTHDYDLSPDRKWAFHTVSRFDEPPRVELVSLPEHVVTRVLVDNGPLRDKAAKLLRSPVEFFQVEIEPGVVLDAWMIKPEGFDPKRRYPLLVYVYGEPAGQTVLDQWPGQTGLFHRALADEGFLVVSFDNRGTPAPKGAGFRKVVYGAVGDLSSRDQAAAVRALARARPYVDSDRVAVWGWSGGGSNTLNVMFRFPDVFDVGVAVAPVPDQTLYDTIYQERYMGLPDDNAAGYHLGSPIHFAEGLKGRLLIVHGSGDDNVHYQGTERLVNRLVELGKRFDLMVYPNRTHAISEGPGTSLHIYNLIARYLLENVAAIPR
jgi:dipeptidyl-peptidase 4